MPAYTCIPTPPLQMLRGATGFRIWIAALMIATGGLMGRGQSPDGTGAEPLSNAYGFALTVPGCADASKNIREISIDELNIDIREMTTGMDVEYRLYGPGQAHWGNARFTVLAGSCPELQAWFAEAAKGKNIRKNITVTLFKSDKTPGRGYNLIDCFPTQWSSVNTDPADNVQTETLTVNIGRIEFKTRMAPPPPTGGPPLPLLAEAPSSDKFAQVRGFKVEIEQAAGRQVDPDWESVHGGELIVELGNQGTKTAKFKTNSPGHKTVGEITLRGAMTDGRQPLCQWINDTVNGKPWKRMCTITELLAVDGGVKDGRAFYFSEGFPIRYVFPTLSVTQTTGNVMEEVTLKMVRVERELPAQLTGLITIPDAPVASAAAVAAGVEDLGMDVNLIPSTGDARDPSAVIVLPVQADGEIQEWLKESAAGLAKPRTITIDLYNHRQPTGQQIILRDCTPISAQVTSSTGNTMEEVEVKPIRVELK